jgi:hypothetical protein
MRLSPEPPRRSADRHAGESDRVITSNVIIMKTLIPVAFDDCFLSCCNGSHTCHAVIKADQNDPLIT